MADEQTTPAPRSTLERLLGDTEPIRRALYPVVVAVVALLVAYGLLDAERVPLWLGLAVAVLGPGGIEAARRVAYAPATVHAYGAEWNAALEGEYARGIADGLEHAGNGDGAAPEVIDDVPGAHAADRSTGEPTEALPEQEAPTGLMRAPSRATRCREVDEGGRCQLTRDHKGPHMYAAG